MANQIRNISQTTQEREIVKTAPDIIVYIDGLPYKLNQYVNDRKTNKAPAVVNFNDHVTAFNCTYDTDIMIPSGSLNLQVPNYQKYLYQLPGGNNLIQPMMQIQVYAKGYFMTNSTSSNSGGDTVYRRVFKGLVSHVAYNDNGKTYEISIQCYGSLYMLELMQINLNPSILTAVQTGSALTYWSTKFAMLNPYKNIAVAFTYGLHTDGFQLTQLTQTAASRGQFGKAVQLGYINKWQSILSSLQGDIHIFGASFKDNLSQSTTKSKESDVKGQVDRNTLADSNAIHDNQTESDAWANDVYYGNIRQFLPERSIGDIQLFNNQIIPRMELIRKMVKLIDFEAYQDIDGKIIVKPPLYNLDVVNIGPRPSQTSTTSTDSMNSYVNPLTQITPKNNPFVVYLSEILTEQESEDQAAIRRTRTVVTGNIDPQFGFGYTEQLLAPAEYIDVGKLIKYGLREEPTISAPWFGNGITSLWAHAVAETVRSNRGYHTYTVTIPLRPELKLGFPVFFPHRDMYGYIKSIGLNYQIGGTATMTITCDSIRRRVLVNTTQKDASNNSTEIYTAAPNLVFKWAKAPANPQPTPGQSPQASNTFLQSQYAGIIQGNSPQTSGNPTDLTGTAATIPATNTAPGTKAKALDSKRQKMGNAVASQSDVADGTTIAQYFIQNDGETAASTVPTDGKNRGQGGTGKTGYYTQQRIVDKTYIEDVKNGTIPFTDDKGYEVLAPFPWGRWQSLNSAIQVFTENGWLPGLTTSDGSTPIVDPQEEQILTNTDAFLYAGLGTPIASGSASDLLAQKNAQISNTIGGVFAPSDPSKPNVIKPDATVLVLSYSAGSSNDSQLLQKPQPEDDLVQNLITNTQNVQQRLVDVLISGNIAPTQLTQEALLATTTQTPVSAKSVGSTPSQQAQEIASLTNTPPSDTDALGPTAKQGQ